jgi:hypothetical protein
MVGGVFSGQEVDPDCLPGAALGMIRAAYREVETQQVA